MRSSHLIQQQAAKPWQREKNQSWLWIDQIKTQASYSNSQVDPDDSPRLVRQHICNNVRSTFDTPERKKAGKWARR